MYYRIMNQAISVLLLSVNPPRILFQNDPTGMEKEEGIIPRLYVSYQLNERLRRKHHLQVPYDHEDRVIG